MSISVAIVADVDLPRLFKIIKFLVLFFFLSLGVIRLWVDRVVIKISLSARAARDWELYFMR